MTFQTIKPKQWQWIATVFIFALYLIPRLLGYLRYGMAGFGYDLGIYRRLINLHFLGQTNTEFGFAGLSTIARLLDASTDQILVYGYIGVFLCLALGVFAVMKKSSYPHLALWAFLLLSVSTVQFEFFSWYYFRNAIAVVFLLLSYTLFERRSPLLFLPLASIGILHPLSLIPILLVFGWIALREKTSRWYLVRQSGIGLVIAIATQWHELARYVLVAMSSSGRVANTASWQQNELTGQFLEPLQYLLLSTPFLPFAIFGAIKHWKKELFWSLFAVANIVLILAQVLLYRRFFVFLDLTIIIFASYGVNDLWQAETHRRMVRTAVILFFSLLWYQLFATAMNTPPRIEPNDLVAVESMNIYGDANTVAMTIRSDYAPWLYGFTPYDIIAPGVFDINRWTEDEWKTFWTTTDQDIRHTLLNRYAGKRVLIFVGMQDEYYRVLLLEDAYITKHSPSVFEYTPL